MRKHGGCKKTLALVLALTLVAGSFPANVGGFLTGGTVIAANAAEQSEEINTYGVYGTDYPNTYEGENVTITVDSDDEGGFTVSEQDNKHGTITASKGLYITKLVILTGYNYNGVPAISSDTAVRTKNNNSTYTFTNVNSPSVTITNDGEEICQIQQITVYYVNADEFHSLEGINNFNAQAEESPTLTLDANYTGSLTVTRDDGVIDLNGHTVNGNVILQNNDPDKTVTIKNGTITGDINSVPSGKDYYKGKVVLENVSVGGNVWTNGHDYTIKSGTYNGIIYALKNAGTTGCTTITGGTFNSSIAAGYNDWQHNADGGTFSVSGGTFASKPAAAFVAEGYTSYWDGSRYTVTNDVYDVTSKLTNPSFETGDITGWEFKTSDNGGARETSSDSNKMSGSDGNWMFNTWDKGWRVHQTVTDLVNGKYRLTAVVASNSGNQVALSANGSVDSVTAVGAENGVTAYVDFYVTDGTADIGAEGVENVWYKVDDFRLFLVDEYEKVEAKAATYTEEGNIEYYKDSNGKYYVIENGKYAETTLEAVTIAVIPLTHHEAVAPTCTENGTVEYWHDEANNRYFLDANGENEVLYPDGITAFAKGHTPAEAVIENEVPATYTSNGSYDSVVYCSVCGEEISRETIVIPMLEKTEVIINSVDINGNQVSTKVYKETFTNADYLLPKDEYYDGYDFKGWNVNGTTYSTTDAAYNAVHDLVTSGTEVTVAVVYEKKADMFGVTVNGGKLANGETSGEYQVSTIMKVTANKAASGKKFSHWTKNGITVSYNETYSFYMPSESITLEAVYVDNATEVEKTSTAIIESVTPDAARGKVAFVSVVNVPTNCTLLKGGVVATSDSSIGENVTSENAAYVRYGTPKKTNTKTYKYTWTKGSITTDTIWYVRPYLVYRDENGIEHSIYGDAVKVNINGIII
ncbi:MAG: hypothetical protein IK999_10060 [Ruminococcus sp.]|nr:hypothetical protein [Ruminococcus sp.]